MDVSEEQPIEMESPTNASFCSGDRVFIATVELKEGRTYELSVTQHGTSSAIILLLDENGRSPIRADLGTIPALRLNMDMKTLSLPFVSDIYGMIYVIVLCDGEVPAEMTISVSELTKMEMQGLILGLAMGGTAGIALAAFIYILMRRRS